MSKPQSAILPESAAKAAKELAHTAADHFEAVFSQTFSDRVSAFLSGQHVETAGRILKEKLAPVQQEFDRTAQQFRQLPSDTRGQGFAKPKSLGSSEITLIDPS